MNYRFEFGRWLDVLTLKPDRSHHAGSYDKGAIAFGLLRVRAIALVILAGLAPEYLVFQVTKHVPAAGAGYEHRTGVRRFRLLCGRCSACGSVAKQVTMQEHPLQRTTQASGMATKDIDSTPRLGEYKAKCQTQGCRFSRPCRVYVRSNPFGPSTFISHEVRFRRTHAASADKRFA